MKGFRSSTGLLAPDSRPYARPPSPGPLAWCFRSKQLVLAEEFWELIDAVGNDPSIVAAQAACFLV